VFFCTCVHLLYFSVNCVLCVFLQYFDTVDWVFRPVKTVACITYTVFVETSNLAQSINQRLNLLLLLLLLWQAPLGKCSAKSRHQSPEWMNLRHNDCFVQEEVF